MFEFIWNLLTWPLRLVTGFLAMVIFLLSLALIIFCIYDCSKRRFRNPNHKWIWIAALVLSWPLGVSWLAAGAYLLIGRQQAYGY